jgi:hypothetical protein
MKTIIIVKVDVRNIEKEKWVEHINFFKQTFIFNNSEQNEQMNKLTFLFIPVEHNNTIEILPLK